MDSDRGFLVVDIVVYDGLDGVAVRVKARFGVEKSLVQNFELMGWSNCHDKTSSNGRTGQLRPARMFAVMNLNALWPTAVGEASPKSSAAVPVLATLPGPL